MLGDETGLWPTAPAAPAPGGADRKLQTQVNREGVDLKVNLINAYSLCALILKVTL